MQPLLTQRQCAEALALSERTLERFRVSGVGPKFVRMGKSVRYRLGDVDRTRPARQSHQDCAQVDN